MISMVWLTLIFALWPATLGWWFGAAFTWSREWPLRQSRMFAFALAVVFYCLFLAWVWCA